jgi:hypothetical protein
MKLKPSALEFLRKFITGDGDDGPNYRTGPELISLFNEFGFGDRYEGFPARWRYVQERLSKLNGKSELRRLIETVFSPELFIGRVEILNAYAKKFNAYLAFSDLELRIENKRAIVLSKAGMVVDVGTIDILSDEFVLDQLRKIDEKLEKGDYDGAISSSRSLVEGVLNAIYLSCKEQDLPKSGDLKQDYKAVRTLLGLAADGKDEPVKQLLNSLTSLIDGIDTLSNRMGDRHRRTYKPLRRHAKLVVNCTKTLVDFLVDTHLERLKKVKS